MLRRLYPSVPERVVPEWARPAHAPHILPAFFAGAWDENQQADRDVLSQLSGKPYEEFEGGLAQWALRPDSPLRKSGSVWKIASPRDALFRLAHQISSAELQRFSRAANDVFRSADPRFAMSSDERRVAPILGHLPTHSQFLRTGLGETLLVLSLFGETARVSGSAAVADRIVRDLLHAADASRWWSLSDELRLLSEAAPEPFLASLQDSLQENDPPVMNLFKEDRGGLFGAAHHSDLLWAMESLAWDPKYLTQTALLLATMSRLDPGGQYANRPKNSLHNIFVWWMPQTCVDFADRINVLDLIRRDEPGVAWELMLTLLPGDHETLSPSARPRWREIPPELPEQGYTSSWVRTAETISDKLLQDVGEDAQRWVSLIEHFSQLPKAHFERATAALLNGAASFDHDARNAIWASLRELLNRHRQFADTAWALPEEMLTPLDKVYAAFAPGDPIERIAWLFDETRGTSPLPEKLDGGWEAYEAMVQVRRREAIAALWTATGLDGIDRLARSVSQPGIVGVALAECDLQMPEQDVVLLHALLADDSKLEYLAKGILSNRLQDKTTGETWAYGLLDRAAEEAWPKRSVLAILVVMNASRKLWDRLEKFGNDVADEYWEAVNRYQIIQQTREDIAYAVDKLLQRGRAIEVLGIVSRKPEVVPSATLVRALREAVQIFNTDVATNANNAQMFQHYLEQTLGELDRRGDVEISTIAQIEWQYLPLIRHSKRSLKTLHRSLQESPSFFVEVLKVVYRAKTETETSADTIEDDDRQDRMVMQAYELLQSWSEVPGMENGAINSSSLESWVAEARRLADEADRIEPCDIHIGRVLAYSPISEDGVWPAEAVRNVIEISRSEVMQGAIASGVLNKRGATWRNPHDGGEPEWGLAKQYHDWAEALRFKSPRTSAAVEDIAKMFEDFARRHDQDTERLDWR